MDIGESLLIMHRLEPFFVFWIDLVDWGLECIREQPRGTRVDACCFFRYCIPAVAGVRKGR